MVQCSGDGGRSGAEALDLEEVRRQLHRMIESRLQTPFSPADEVAFERLTRREAELLRRD